MKTIILLTLFTILLIRFILRLLYNRPANKLRGNPNQNGQPVGIGRTVGNGYRFKHQEDYHHYIRNEIGKISKTIHK